MIKFVDNTATPSYESGTKNIVKVNGDACETYT